MDLRRLSIHALPGIEPGFTFEPRDAGINIVVGPNAIGKSSLSRALRYLLASHASDPPALSLEAELASGDVRWWVRRNGGQIVWRRNGEVASRPVLPGADRMGLFRLSVEHLLDADDANDRELAGRLWRELHGNYDLSQPRIEVTRRFALHDAGRLAKAAGERRRVEGEYVDLQRREAELPDLERRIGDAIASGARRGHLQQALELADAIDARKEREAALQRFPPGMDRVRATRSIGSRGTRTGSARCATSCAPGKATSKPRTASSNAPGLPNRRPRRRSCAQRRSACDDSGSSPSNAAPCTPPCPKPAPSCAMRHRSSTSRATRPGWMPTRSGAPKRSRNH